MNKLKTYLQSNRKTVSPFLTSLASAEYFYFWYFYFGKTWDYMVKK